MELVKKSTVGSRIAGVRRARKVSQDLLAGYIGVSKRYLSKIENDRAKPSGVLVAAIAKGLDISTDYLLTGEER